MRFFKTGKEARRNPSATDQPNLPDFTESSVAASLRHVSDALKHHQAGHLAEAEAAYRHALAEDSGNVDALHFLGVISYQRKDYKSAESLIAEALSRDESNAPAHNNLGNVLVEQRRFEDAVVHYQKALALVPGYVDARVNLGAAFKALGRPGDAIANYRMALELAPENPTIHFNMANLLAGQGSLEEASACYRKALAFKPGYPEAFSNLGNVLRSRGLLDEAVDCFGKAIALLPDFPEAHSNFGNVLRDQGRLEEAIECYRRALLLKPDFPEACVNMGYVLDAQGRRNEAIGWHDRALALRPDYAEAYAGLGNALKNDGRPDEAIDKYRRAIELKPGYVEAICQLGDAYREQDRLEEAHQCYRRALSVDTMCTEARWSLTMSQLPAISTDKTERECCRAAFSSELDELIRWFDALRVSEGHRAVGIQTPFYVAYQEENNRDLLRRHGDLCARIMADWLKKQALPPVATRNADSVIRVGIVSRHFHSHSVWNAIIKGWFQKFDRRRFALLAFCIGSKHDQETQYAKTHAAHFEQGERTFRQWMEAISRQCPDVLIYPGIGMDPITMKLASLRLAPVQVATWGHPETTGLPTIDYYLSAEGMEPMGAQENYTEQLVMLPHLGCYYDSPRVIPNPPDLASLESMQEVPIFLCPGVPFKYAPEHDAIFPEIARRTGRCRFVFFNHQTRSFSEKLRRRIKVAFDRVGLGMDEFVTFVPWQDWPGFYGWLERADVFLDTIGFSGFNTAMQAVECHLPIVTREGRFLRGRFASGMLRQMGLHELIAVSDEEYVTLAVRLARDRDYRERIRGKIEAARDCLFEDTAPIDALEEFLSEVVTKQRPPLAS
jgi:protein O-GlcNAc transferase